MSVHVSKSSMFRVTVSVNENILTLMKQWPEVTDEALQEAAVWWHENILPQHFNHGAAAKYGYVQRTLKYLRQRGKQGKPYLYFTGGMARDLKAQAAVMSRRNAVELRMHARTLNLVPRMAQDDDAPRILRTKKGANRNFPNLVREVKVILDDEREAMAQVVVSRVQSRFAEAQARRDDMILI